ncbi:MAG: twin-arginine translocase TatA/TatE family subunit [Planctomycetia bacterium]|nr:twin-arginine translocase TatA/TatE family subunit [Planctomycetia bacterium]
MFGLGPVEIVVIGAIAVMLYGKRLPEVGRSVGQTIGELRKQMASLSREMDLAAHVDGSAAKRASRRIGAGDEGPQTAGPRFDPPAAAEENAAS